jgi:hypothetical protein
MAEREYNCPEEAALDQALQQTLSVHPAELTFQAELLGQKVVELLHHPVQLVREGALVGLGGVVRQIHDMALRDPCQSIRMLAQEMRDEEELKYDEPSSEDPT